MQKFVIERTIPGAGDLSADELAAIAETSNATAATLGVPYVWHESFAAGDTVYCVHSAESADDVMEHSRRAGFPVDKVTPVGSVFGPGTAHR